MEPTIRRNCSSKRCYWLTVTADEARQLRVVRAFFYYRLLDLYGTAKYVTEAGDEGQLSRADLFAKVEGELLDVVGLTRADITSGNIAPTAFGTTNAYRVNHFAVLGLLSKLYLNAEVYTRATFRWNWYNYVDRSA